MRKWPGEASLRTNFWSFCSDIALSSLYHLPAIPRRPPPFVFAHPHHISFVFLILGAKLAEAEGELPHPAPRGHKKPRSPERLSEGRRGVIRRRAEARRSIVGVKIGKRRSEEMAVMISVNRNHYPFVKSRSERRGVRRGKSLVKVRIFC